MAYNIGNINVLDRRKSTGVGVALPFESAEVFRTVYQTSEQLKYNIINFLLTDKRERIFNPEFGLGIRARLFEQINLDTFDQIEAQIRSGIENYFTSVIITDLIVTGDPNRNLIKINFSYTIGGTGESDNILIEVNG